MPKTSRPKIGLALGAGGKRGLIHLSVIKVLEENNIPIDFIAGSSIGAWLGAFYCAKKNIKELEKIVLSLNRSKLLSLFFDPSLDNGLFGGEKIKKFFENYLGKITFDDLKIPFCAVATDFCTGQSVYLNKGPVVPAIFASGAMPLLFKPVCYNNRLLIDGGASMPIPITPLKEMGADITLAVNLYYQNLEEKDNLNFYKIINNSIGILITNLARENSKEADFVFSPNLTDPYLDVFLKEGEEMIKKSEAFFGRQIPELKELIKKKSGLL